MGPFAHSARTRRASIRTVLALVLVCAGILGAASAQAGPSVTVTITSAPPSTTTSTSATITFTTSGAKKTQCKLDSSGLATCSSPVTYSGLPGGTHTFVVKATDRNGKSVSASATWNVVSSTPTGYTVASSIGAGSTLTGSVAWEAKTSTTASEVDFYVDGALKWTEHYAPYLFNGDPGGLLDTTTLSDGSHVLKVVATAASSGATAETSSTVQVANTPSTAFTVVSSIADGATISGSVNWQATTSRTASTVDFYVDGVLKWTEHQAPFVFNGDGGALDSTTLSGGNHALKVVATAVDGASAETSETVQVANGTSPAQLTVSSSISDGSTLSGSVTWEATPSTTVSNVAFYVDGSLRYTDSATPFRYNGDTGKLDTTTLSNGSHSLRAVATATSSTAAATASIEVANLATSPPPASNAAGRPKYMQKTDSSQTSVLDSPNSTLQQWFRDKWQRALVYSPYWDSRLAWYPNAWDYIDAYAIYNPSNLANQHPDWILKDASGNKLYIPWGCGGGTCPQYAADIGNPAWRDYIVNVAKTAVAKGYKGIHLDDVNMDINVGNGLGQKVTPIDPRTGTQMTDSAWKLYFADFMEQVRAAIPTAEIAHNAVWFNGGGLHDGTQPEVAREIKAADYYNMERGFVDSGLTGGTGIWSVYAMFRFIDTVHSYGKHVVIQSYATNLTDAEYNLAGYLLINDGNDYVSSTAGSMPSGWWSGYDVNLGAATTGRYLWNGVWRRDFTGGTVLLNEPGASTKTLSLGATYQTTSGATVSSVTLGAARGAVLSS